MENEFLSLHPLTAAERLRDSGLTRAPAESNNELWITAWSVLEGYLHFLIAENFA